MPALLTSLSDCSLSHNWSDVNSYLSRYQTEPKNVICNPDVVETENHNDTETLGYKNFDWGLFPGFQLPHHTKIGRRAWIWTQMYEVEETVTGIKYGVCKHCLKSRPTLKGN
ncbi:hypothetical protein V8E54_014631 [Elaphomyces granulatus]